MLKSIMQKNPETIVAKFHSIFTTQVLLAIIGGLIGIIAMRLMGI
jgi:predicted PurR-regulated permease PerM